MKKQKPIPPDFPYLGEDKPSTVQQVYRETWGSWESALVSLNIGLRDRFLDICTSESGSFAIFAKWNPDRTYDDNYAELLEVAKTLDAEGLVAGVCFALSIAGHPDNACLSRTPFLLAVGMKEKQPQENKARKAEALPLDFPSKASEICAKHGIPGFHCLVGNVPMKVALDNTIRRGRRETRKKDLDDLLQGFVEEIKPRHDTLLGLFPLHGPMSCAQVSIFAAQNIKNISRAESRVIGWW